MPRPRCLDISMALNVTNITICYGVFLLWSSVHLPALIIWSGSALWLPWPGVTKALPRVSMPRSFGVVRGVGSVHSPLRQLLAASAQNEGASGAGCGAAFPLVEATISGVHAAFMDGTLNCSQLVAVRVLVTTMTS